MIPLHEISNLDIKSPLTSISSKSNKNEIIKTVLIIISVLGIGMSIRFYLNSINQSKTDI